MDSMETEHTHIADHPVIRFGQGDRSLVIIPGLNDALQGDESSRFTRLLLEQFSTTAPFECLRGVSRARMQ